MTVQTQADFRAFVHITVLPKLLELIAYKGKQYTGEAQSCFVNFEEGAKLAQDTSEHYLMVQATKSWYVISDWSKRASREEAGDREIIQRVYDIITYCFILLFMLVCKEEVSHADISGPTN